MNRREFLAALSALTLGPCAARPAEDAAFLPGKLTQLTHPGGGDNRATYMPDGKALLFASTRTGRSQIWSMDPDRGDARRLCESEADDYGRVAPSPDGTRLCFSSDRDGENAVYVLDLRTGAVTRVSDLASWSFGPTWSSRDLIAYFSRKGGNRINIWTVRPDGSRARQVTTGPAKAASLGGRRTAARSPSQLTTPLVPSRSGSLRRTARTRGRSQRGETGSSRSGAPTAAK